MRATIATPVGYWLEFRPGRVLLMSPDEFARETNRDGACIWGLFPEPQPGCNSGPAAYRGNYWHEAKHYKYNQRIDPDARPVFRGQMLQRPDWMDEEGDLRGVPGPLPEHGWD